jgi:hypothetical protein
MKLGKNKGKKGVIEVKKLHVTREGKYIFGRGGKI